MSDREIVFYKSIKSGRWWMEMDNNNYMIIKLNHPRYYHALIKII